MTLQEQMCLDLSLTSEEYENIVNSEHRLHRIIKIPKKSGSGERVIYSPSPKAKLIQLWIVKKIFKDYNVSTFSFAYVEEKNIKLNAIEHRKNKYSFKYDLKNFFPSIKFKFFKSCIADYIGSFKSKNEILEIIKQFCFLRDESLPQGYCSSPLISNIVMKEIDTALNEQLKKVSDEVVYTRYADDMTISFARLADKERISKIIEDFFSSKEIPFNLNMGKKRFGNKKSGSMFVNGIKICHNDKITIHRTYKDRIRSFFYSYRKGLMEIGEKTSFLGHIYYVRSVDPEYYNKLNRKYFNEIKKLKEDVSI